MPKVLKTLTAGRSLLEILWEELDSIIDQLMSEDEPDKPKEDLPSIAIGVLCEGYKMWGELRGQAQGVAYAIAVITDPYSPNVPAVREQAMQRWEEGAG